MKLNTTIKTATVSVAFFVALGTPFASAATVIQQRHAVPYNPAQAAGLSKAPWTQLHAHSTANETATMQNTWAWLSRTYNDANYTHLVGWNYETGRAESWEVMPKGGAFDMGGIDNWEGWASVEFNENIPNAAAFRETYQVYIDTLRQLADEINVSYDLDDGTNIGIVSHKHSSEVGRGSDHIDPHLFLAKWGVSEAQFKLDLKTGKAFSGAFNDKLIPDKETKPAPKPKPTTKDSKSIQAFKKHSNAYYVSKTVTVDKIAYVSGMWQMYSNDLAGGKNGDWTNNGVPLSMVDNTSRGNVLPTKVGDKVKVAIPFNYGTVDHYDATSNGVGIVMGAYGLIWFNADQVFKM